MTFTAFDTAIEDSDGVLAGPWRRPHQMLPAQEYDAHADPVATMLLNIASIKESYATYSEEYAKLYG